MDNFFKKKTRKKYKLKEASMVKTMDSSTIHIDKRIRFQEKIGELNDCTDSKSLRDSKTDNLRSTDTHVHVIRNMDEKESLAMVKT